jgi:hypothetical protein
MSYRSEGSVQNKKAANICSLITNIIAISFFYQVPAETIVVGVTVVLTTQP